jgi:hypothetical protein
MELTIKDNENCVFKPRRYFASAGHLKAPLSKPLTIKEVIKKWS